MYTSFLTSHAWYYRNDFGKSYHGIVATYGYLQSAVEEEFLIVVMILSLLAYEVEM